MKVVRVKRGAMKVVKRGAMKVVKVKECVMREAQ